MYRLVELYTVSDLTGSSCLQITCIIISNDLSLIDDHYSVANSFYLLHNMGR